MELAVYTGSKEGFKVLYEKGAKIPEDIVLQLRKRDRLDFLDVIKTEDLPRTAACDLMSSDSNYSNTRPVSK